MSDDMHTRVSRAEWEITALKDAQQAQASQMAELSTRIDIHHKEVMGAIGSLRDDRSKSEGAAEERTRIAERNQRAWRIAAVIAGIIGTAATLGVIFL